MTFSVINNYASSLRLPSPTPPNPRLFLPVMVDSFVIAIVVYAISFSMAKIFSRKHHYPVCATQELYAGVGSCL